MVAHTLGLGEGAADAAIRLQIAFQPGLRGVIRDLLQAEWNVALEAFRTGRDRGIDLRYVPADGGASIIQCKHYAASGSA